MCKAQVYICESKEEKKHLNLEIWYKCDYCDREFERLDYVFQHEERCKMIEPSIEGAKIDVEQQKRYLTVD